MFDRNLLALLAGAVREDLQITDVEIGLLFGTAFGIAYFVASIPAGWAMDRYSRRALLLCGVVIWSFGTMGSAFSIGFLTLYLCRAIVGAGEAVVLPGAHSIIGDSFPSRSISLPMSIFTIGGKAGVGLSFLLGGLLIGLIDPYAEYQVEAIGAIAGWKLIFLVAGIPGLLLAPLVYLNHEPDRKLGSAVRGDSSFKTYLDYLRENWRFFTGHHLASAGMSITIASLIVWAPTYLERVHRLGTAQAGIWLSVALTIGPVVTIPLHGWLVDRWFSRGRLDAHMRYMMWAVIISCPIAAGAYLAPTPTLALLLLGAAATILSGYLGLPAASLQIVVPPTLRAKASALLSIFVAVGTMIGATLPPLVNRMLWDDPLDIGLSTSLALCFSLPLTALLYAFARKPMRALVVERETCSAAAQPEPT